MRLFRQRGYSGVTIDDIVADVGVTKGGFYHHFKSKSALLFELHEMFVDYSVARIQAAVTAESDPAAQVHAYLREVFSQIDKHSDYVQVLFDERRWIPQDMIGVIEKKEDDARALLERLVSGGVKAGVFGKIDPKLAALAISGMSIWAYQWYSPAGRVPHGKIADAFTDLILEGLRRPPASRNNKK